MSRCCRPSGHRAWGECLHPQDMQRTFHYLTTGVVNSPQPQQLCIGDAQFIQPVPGLGSRGTSILLGATTGIGADRLRCRSQCMVVVHALIGDDDTAKPVLSQHPLLGSRTFANNAIGQSQGGVHWLGPNLRMQVQNFAAHGMVGFLIDRLT
jgi:hypothetical protein